jgi:hypothetical protein
MKITEILRITGLQARIHTGTSHIGSKSPDTPDDTNLYVNKE